MCCIKIIIEFVEGDVIELGRQEAVVRLKLREVHYSCSGLIAFKLC